MAGRLAACARLTLAASATRVILLLLFSVVSGTGFGQEPAAPSFNVDVQVEERSTTDERVQALEEQVRELRAALSRSNPQTPAVKVPESTKYPTIKLNGMLHIDGGWVEQDAANRAQLGDIDNSLGFRRARIGVEGFLTEHLYYRLVPDFALGGRPSFRDAYVEYQDLGGIGTIRLGESRQPFGMDSQTPANHQPFLERSLANALSPFRQVGLGVRNHNEDETVTWHVGAFGFPTDSFANAVSDSGFGIVGRVTALPWTSADQKSLVHVGVDYGWEHPGEAGLRYRSTPEYGGLLTGPNGNTQVVPPFVDTGVLVNATSNLFNVELASITGPLVLQAEAVCALTELENGDSANFAGGYVEALFVLTGEVHEYDHEFGSIERLKPNCPITEGGIGAWELTGRLSTLDLNDGPVDGGRVHDATLGVNWFLNHHTRLQFNAIRSFLDRAPEGKSQANIYAARLAVDF